MTQRDYILRIAEGIGRALAQIVYHRQVKDYQGAHELIDQQIKQTFGMGSGFIHSISDETLLAMLTTLGTLNIDKCWLLATLLKVEGELYEEQQDENASYYSSLKACNLFLEALYETYQKKRIEEVHELEVLWKKLEAYALPLRTRQLFFWYFEYTGRYAQAEEILFDILDTETSEEMENVEEVEEMLACGEAFYLRLFHKTDQELAAGNLARARLQTGLAKLHQLAI